MICENFVCSEIKEDGTLAIWKYCTGNKFQDVVSLDYVTKQSDPQKFVWLWEQKALSPYAKYLF